MVVLTTKKFLIKDAKKDWARIFKQCYIRNKYIIKNIIYVRVTNYIMGWEMGDFSLLLVVYNTT